MMNKIKSLTLFSTLALAPFFLGCDGNSNGNNDDTVDELSKPVVRGLDPAEILANPTGTPGFPFSLAAGETITFLPSDVPASSFIEQVPLGTWDVAGAGIVRQGANSTGFLDFPVTEQSFRYLYGTSNNDTPTTVSTQSSAFLQYSFQHEITSRVQQFVPRMDQILASSISPGSLFHALNSDGGLISDRNRILVDAISSIGMAAVIYPGATPPTTDPDVTSVAVRRFRFIQLRNITSTNADLAGANPTIVGQYTLTDSWHQVMLDDDEGQVTLRHTHAPISEVRFTEESSGTFVIRLNQLTAQP